MYYCSEFRLFAHGVNFDADAYVASTPLRFDGVWHKGENGADHPKSSGVFKTLGDGLKVPLDEQEEIAIEYLSTNRDELKVLAQHPDVKTFILGLHCHIELEPSIDGFSLGPSSSLMWHALDIGVRVNFYISLDRSRDCD
jgi:hypothetical protein